MVILLALSETYYDISSTAKTWQALIPLLSPLVIILIFITDRFIVSHHRKKEVERNWYLRILIEPGISQITNFYTKASENYKKSSETLCKFRDKAHFEFNLLKSEEFGKFQSLKRVFEIAVIYPIQVRYPDVGKQISEQLRDLEDEYTSWLDQEKFSDNDIKEFNNFVAKNRAIFLNHLYSPLK